MDMKKIMFNDHYGLTQAVIAGRKTMTRRVLSGYPLTPSDRIEDAQIYPDGSVGIIANGGESLMVVKCRYRVGEIVAVAQSYEQVYHQEGLETIDMFVSGLRHTAGWRNKMFVRAELMPHRIRITDVRVERLQDISDEDCLREGIFVEEFFDNGEKHRLYSFTSLYNEGEDWFGERWSNTPRSAFASLIDKVSGRGTWESNPWVFVYEFEPI